MILLYYFGVVFISEVFGDLGDSFIFKWEMLGVR